MKEYPPEPKKENDESAEHYDGVVVDSVLAKLRSNEQVKNDKKEREFDERAGLVVNTEGELEEIENQKEEIKKLMETPVDEPVHEHTPLKTETTHKKPFLKRALVGLTALLSFGAAKANEADSSVLKNSAVHKEISASKPEMSNKVHFIENKDDFGGLKLEGMTYFPTPDSTKKVYGLTFSFDKKIKGLEALNKIRIEAEKKGYTIEDDQMIKLLSKLHGEKARDLISIKKTFDDADDTKLGLNANAINKVYPATNALGKFTTVERDTIDELDLHTEYQVLVSKKTDTVNYKDTASK